jgi:hypothetical protein
MKTILKHVEIMKTTEQFSNPFSMRMMIEEIIEEGRKEVSRVAPMKPR